MWRQSEYIEYEAEDSLKGMVDQVCEDGCKDQSRYDTKVN